MGRCLLSGRSRKRKEQLFNSLFYTDVNKNEKIKSNNMPEIHNVSKEIYMELWMELGDILLLWGKWPKTVGTDQLIFQYSGKI